MPLLLKEQLGEALETRLRDKSAWAYSSMPRLLKEQLGEACVGDEAVR